MAVVEQCIKDYLADSDWSWRTVDKHAFLHNKMALEVTTTSAQQAARASLRDVQPTGPDAIELRRLMTELQMAMHEKLGDVDFNSLWVWGTALRTSIAINDSISLGNAASKPYDSASEISLPPLWTNDAYSRGVYRMHNSEANCHDLPHQFDTTFTAGEHAIAVVRDDLAVIEQNWFAPALNALDRGRIRTVYLHLDGCYAKIERSPWRRWFARSQPLIELPS